VKQAERSSLSVFVNGERFVHKGAHDLAALVEALDADGDRVATMLNDEMVCKEARSVATLQAGDRIEVLVFAGGG
jgi:sulfur carrier protein